MVLFGVATVHQNSSTLEFHLAKIRAREAISKSNNIEDLSKVPDELENEALFEIITIEEKPLLPLKPPRIVFV